MPIRILFQSQRRSLPVRHANSNSDSIDHRLSATISPRLSRRSPPARTYQQVIQAAFAERSQALQGPKQGVYLPSFAIRLQGEYQSKSLFIMIPLFSRRGHIAARRCDARAPRQCGNALCSSAPEHRGCGDDHNPHPFNA